MAIPAQTDQAAVRSDPDAHIVDSVTFVGPAGRKMFASLHAPSSPPSGAVVVCCSIHAGFELWYRREVLLARSLASQGIAALRFHYRGTGNSDSDVQDMTFGSMVEDSLSAREWLAARTGVATPSFLGIGWDGLVAASAARSGQEALALWEPVVQASDYFREASRARASRDVKEGVTERPSPTLLSDELAAAGRFEVLGYSIERALYESALPKSLAGELGERSRPILLVQIGRRKRLRSDYATLLDGWRRAGFPVESHVVSGEESWWFAGDRWEPQERRASTVEVLDRTTRWLLAHLPTGADS